MFCTANFPGEEADTGTEEQEADRKNEIVHYEHNEVSYVVCESVESGITCFTESTDRGIV